MGQKKKWTDHPIHPSVNKKSAGAPGTPWREEKYDISVSLNFFRIQFWKKFLSIYRCWQYVKAEAPVWILNDFDIENQILSHFDCRGKDQNKYV